MVIFIEGLIEKDLEVLLFVNKYKYVKASDFEYLYSYKQYYKKRLKFLYDNKYLRRIKWYATLGSLGKKYLESLGYRCSRISYEKKYIERQKIISSLASYFYNSKKVMFIPSIDLKDKNIFTITSRRYIGILNIEGTKYLTYYIHRKQSNKYVQSVIYDIRKESKIRNVIVFVEDISLVNIKDFVFGLDKVLIIPAIKENIILLENIYKIDYLELFLKYYKEKVYISEYDAIDYCTKSNISIFPLPFIDAEKLSTIRYFLLENKNRKADILYSKNISLLSIDKIKDANYRAVDYTKFIKGEFNIYD